MPVLVVCQYCGESFETKGSGRVRKFCSRHCAGLAVGGKNYENLAGKRFGRLTVVSKADKASNGMVRWNCECECGGKSIVQTGHLNNGSVLSCGCYNIERTKDENTKHGLSHDADYVRFNKHRRVNQLDQEWTLEMEKAIRVLFPVCVVCGGTRRLATDHVRPLSKGYGLRPGNAVILCTPCNSTKHDKELDELPDDWKIKIEQAAKQFDDYWNRL